MPRATALVNVGQRINGAMSTAILTTVLLISLQWHGAPAGTSITDGSAPLPFMLRSFHDAFWVMTAVSAVGMVMACFLQDRVLAEWKAQARQPSTTSEAVVAGDD